MIDPAYLEKIGVFQAADGSYKRYRVRIRNIQYDPTDPQAYVKGKMVSYDEEQIPFPVVLPLGTDPDSIETGQAARGEEERRLLSPVWGWLRWGIKPEKDHPENLGAGAVQYARRRVVVGQPTEDPPPEGAPAAASAAPKGGKAR